MNSASSKGRLRRVVFLSSIGLGPPYHGNRIRLGTLVDTVRASGAEVSFVGLNLPDAEYEALSLERVRPLANLRGSLAWKLRDRSLGRALRWLRRRLASLNGKPALNNSLDAGVAPDIVRKLAALQAQHRFDAAVVVYAVNTLALTAFPKPCVTIIESQDILTDRNAAMARFGIVADWHSLSAADEARALNRADVILAIQHAEADYFRTLAEPRVRTLTVRHLVEPKAIPLTVAHGRIGIIASDNPINVRSVLWFIDSVFDRLIAAGNDITLVLAGSICRLVQPAGRPIKLLGEIRDTDDFYRQIALTVNPTIGGTGLKIKTIEAMSAGRGVVGSPSAMTGLKDCIGQGLLIAETADDYLAVLGQLLRTTDAVPKLGDAAHAAAQRVYRESMDNLDSLLAAIPTVS